MGIFGDTVTKTLAMDLMRKYGVWIFAFLLLFHCLCIYMELNEARMVSKLLLIPVLIIYLASKNPKASLLVYFGLAFAFIGDLALSQSGDTFFLVGMLAFVGTHLCNTIYFIRLQKGVIGFTRIAIAGIFLLTLFTTIILKELKPNLGKFELPVYFYVAIIYFMAITATASISKPLLKRVAMQYFIPGAFLFVLSDSLLAMNKFIWHGHLMDIIVMLTYGLAQYFLVCGFIRVGGWQAEDLIPA
jgi:uncharacterized membrane protein YhhN